MSAIPGPISCVTLRCPDLEASIEAYGRELGYRIVVTGCVSANLARLWASPASAGCRMALLEPPSGSEMRFRFIEGRREPGYRIFRTLGWNAAELIVQDVDDLAARLQGSCFRIIGPPADLSFSDQIRAMQVVGPADEVLYLTMAKSKLESFDLPEAKAYVDRVFIVVLGGRSLESLQSWFAAALALERAPAMSSVISVLSAQYGLPADTLHSIAAIPLRGQCYIEVDQMPPAAVPRTSERGELPPGIAMVTLAVQQLPTILPGSLSPAMQIDDPGYGGRRAVTCRGAAGELIELLETG